MPVSHQSRCIGRRRRTPRRGKRKLQHLQRAAKAKVALGEALTKQDWERQQRLTAERELDVADRRDLAECLKSGKGLLTRDQGQ